jgi:hypothetical protein
VAKQHKSSGDGRTDLDARIAELSGRVFKRLEGWAKMALIATSFLGLLGWTLGIAAVRGLRSFPMVAIFLVVALIPSVAAWIIGRKAKAVHESVDELQIDLKAAIGDPEIRHLFDGFLGHDNDGDDGRAGLARLARGALGVRKVVKERKDSLIHLAAAVRTMVTSPGVLVVVTAGMAMLALLIVLFGLILIF